MVYLSSSSLLGYFHNKKVYLYFNANQDGLYYCLEYYEIIYHISSQKVVILNIQLTSWSAFVVNKNVIKCCLLLENRILNTSHYVWEDAWPVLHFQMHVTSDSNLQCFHIAYHCLQSCSSLTSCAYIYLIFLYTKKNVISYSH